MTWRKGLRWDKGLQSWVGVATGKPFTKKGLQRRKTMAKRGTLRLAKPKPKPKPRLKLKPKPKPKPKVKPRVKPKKRRKREPRSKRDKARQAIHIALKKAELELSDLYVIDERTHPNKDGTIDAELRVRPKRGQTVRDIFIDMENVFKSEGKILIPLPEDAWVTTGIRYKPRDREEWYLRFKGLSQANTYYQKSKYLAENFTGGRMIDQRMSDKRRRKAEQVIFRVHWNPKNKKPVRDRQESPSKGKKK